LSTLRSIGQGANTKLKAEFLLFCEVVAVGSFAMASQAQEYRLRDGIVTPDIQAAKKVVRVMNFQIEAES